MTAQELVNRLIQLGMTPTEIASASGSTQPTISRIKDGISGDPGSRLFVNLLRIAKQRDPSILNEIV